MFISYARATSASRALALHAALGGGDGLAFLDTAGIAPGDGIPRSVFDALLAARVVVILVDATYLTRRYCLQELRVGVRAFEVLCERGSPGDALEEALRPIVVGLPPEGAGPGVMQRLPPPIAGANWPDAADLDRLTALVRARLGEVRSTLADRLDRIGELASLRERVLGTFEVPPPRLVRGVPAYLGSGLVQSLGEGFVGRAAELWRIHTALAGTDPDSPALTGSLEGGAGFGKSQLAAEYLHRFGPDNFSGGLFWIRADVPEDRVEAQLHGALRALAPEVPDLAEFRRQSRDAARELAEALDRVPADRPVLYVVDEVPEPEAGRPPVPLSTWCPAPGRVAMLVTSRFRRSLAGGVTSLPVGELTPAAAVTLLTREHSGRAALTEAEWRRVAGWVGHLPLALQLLNAGLRAGAVAPAELLALADGTAPVAELDRQMEALRGQVPAGSLRGVTEALSVSYERLSAPARRAACALAALAAEPIPLALVRGLGAQLLSPTVRADLTMRSLVIPVTDGAIPMFGRMHPVLADFLRGCAADPAGDHRLLGDALLSVMTPDACRDPGAWPLMDACRPHAEALVGRTGVERPAPLLIQLGNRLEVLLAEQGRLDRAAAAGEGVLARATAAYGPDHLRTLHAAGNLALHLLHVGDLERALELQRRALAGLRRLLGEDHLDTVWAKAGLAAILDARGDLVGAVALHEEVLRARAAALGDEHPDTVAAMNGLAGALRARGDLERARRLAEQALALVRRLRGDAHPDVLATKGTLAGIRRAMGDLPGAVALAVDVLAGCRRLLGDEHPSTLSARLSLAQLRADMGDGAGAEAVARSVLSARRRLLGDDHPDTLSTRLQLSLLLHDRGQVGAARRLSEETYAGRRRRLGREHPETLEAMGYLSALRHDAGDDDGAVALAEELLAIQRAHLGSDHPRTARTLALLGAIAYGRGELERARVLTQEALEGCERRRGEDDPETLAIKSRFAALLFDMGDREEARAVQLEVVDAASRRLGRDHPETQRALRDLAAMRGQSAADAAGTGSPGDR